MKPEDIQKVVETCRAEVSTMNNKIRSLNNIITSMQALCEHEWEYEYTCGHKGEDYFKCKRCGMSQ